MNPLNNIDYSDPNEIALTRQKTLRKLVGVLGVSLPLLLYFFLFADNGYSKTLESISHYYYTRVSGIFVITLSLLAIFLMIYKGKGKADFILSTLAGSFALLVVLFPTNNINPSGHSSVVAVTQLNDSPFRNGLHYVSAAIFLLSLACMSLFVFTKSDKPEELRTRRKKIRNIIYRVTGIVMVAAIFVVFIDAKLMHISFFGDSLTFWMETIAVECFGFAWLTKAEVFFGD